MKMATPATSETHAELYALKLRLTAEVIRLQTEVRQWRQRYTAATRRHVRRAGK
jgi:hypothetical protein